MFPVNSIKPVTEGKNGWSGGLIDVGNFVEGFCWAVVAESENQWVMCS
jgi:hypothetical protein